MMSSSIIGALTELARSLLLHWSPKNGHQISPLANVWITSAAKMAAATIKSRCTIGISRVDLLIGASFCVSSASMQQLSGQSPSCRSFCASNDTAGARRRDAGAGLRPSAPPIATRAILIGAVRTAPHRSGAGICKLRLSGTGECRPKTCSFRPGNGDERYSWRKQLFCR